MMAARLLIAALLATPLITGCADRFRPSAAASAAAGGAPEPGAATAARLRIASPPPDLAWLADSFRLFNALEPETSLTIADAAATEQAAASNPMAVSGVGTADPTGQRASHDGTDIDLRFVSLPLTGPEAAELMTVPSAVEAAIAPALLPSALQAAQQGGRTVALPVAVRWLALAWNPIRLAESPAPVPPHLEAWVNQLRALKQRQPGQPPLTVAWDEQEIAGSFALLLAAHGGRLLDEAGEPAFVSPEGEAVVRLMIRMLEERLVQPNALETTAERLAASLAGPSAYWLCSSDALSRDGAAGERISGLRINGLPVLQARYRYPDMAAVTLVQYRAVAVPDGSRSAAWRVARLLTDPVVLRSAPAETSVLNAPPPTDSVLVRQARGLARQPGAVPWSEPEGLNAALGRFLHAALRRILTPREALERAALQYRQPGALPEQTRPAESASPAGTAAPMDSSETPAATYPETTAPAPGGPPGIPGTTVAPPASAGVPQAPPAGTSGPPGVSDRPPSQAPVPAVPLEPGVR